MIRRGGQLDVPFMRSMLVHAYNWHIAIFDTAVPLTRYVDGWGRPGDAVLVATDGGHRVGAAWYRLFSASRPGFGFVDEQTPELTVAVVPGRRGEGIGLELFHAALESAREAGHPAISVSVAKDDPGVQFYEDEGFERVRETEHAVVLRRDL